jgi:hypothetical protein
LNKKTSLDLVHELNGASIKEIAAAGRSNLKTLVTLVQKKAKYDTSGTYKNARKI